ncbi:NUDIX hydrolase [Halococcus sp. AFM35]|uniref:NUDIX hydrolase n=1 Tax=Halococcus sp. AFM35 TaxID=3421653 RepID=UPI003EB98B7D
MSRPAIDPAPAALASRYEDVLWAENTFEVDPEALESARARAGRGWGVGALAVADNEMLLVRQGEQWLFPGGMLEAGETPAAGAAREVREETGIDVHIDGLAAIAEQTFTDGRESFVFHFAAFDATAESHEVTADPGLEDEPIHDVAWHESLPENAYDRDLYVRLLDRKRGGI